MFNFQEELEEQLQELIEKYGEDYATKYWIDDYYDGEYCNPPVYRWSALDASAVWQFDYCHAYSWPSLSYGIIGSWYH